MGAPLSDEKVRPAVVVPDLAQVLHAGVQPVLSSGKYTFKSVMVLISGLLGFYNSAQEAKVTLVDTTAVPRITIAPASKRGDL